MMRNSLVLAGVGAVLALGLVEYGCSSSSNNGGTGGAHTGQGGSTTGQGGSATGQGGSSTGSGGSTTGSGGSTTGAGGSTTAGTGGATGSDGGTGLGMCQAPIPNDKGGCNGNETSCTKPCGPNVADLNLGRPQKACACTGGPMVAGFPMSWDCSGGGICAWPPALAAVACFHLPATVPLCPTDPTADGGSNLLRPNATTCTLGAGEMCGQICGSNVMTQPSYQDSNGAPKVGYCVCSVRAAGGARWQCASTMEWAPQTTP
jgi:hypothetical protein